MIKSEIQNGTSNGSGALIGKNRVLTVAHLLYDRKNKL
jgi:V8-like Glu-specific endopeptidase